MCPVLNRICMWLTFHDWSPSTFHVPPQSTCPCVCVCVLGWLPPCKQWTIYTITHIYSGIRGCVKKSVAASRRQDQNIYLVGVNSPPPQSVTPSALAPVSFKGDHWEKSKRASWGQRTDTPDRYIPLSGLCLSVAHTHLLCLEVCVCEALKCVFWQAS